MRASEQGTGGNAAGGLTNAAFPRSNGYPEAWMLEHHMGPNAVWLTEWLSGGMELQEGMRVLDLGCGKAMSSIFLAREFGVRVWATDLWIDAASNWARVREMGETARVCPIHAEAHDLPYADGFFDAIVSVDAYHYFGTDDLYLARILSLLEPGGRIGIVVPGLMRELDGAVPEHLSRPGPSGGRFWEPSECFSIHTLDWWARHWGQTGLVEIETADSLEHGWRHWLEFIGSCHDAGCSFYDDEIPALEADKGRYLGFHRLIARKR